MIKVITKCKSSLKNVILFQCRVLISKTLYSRQGCYMQEGFGGQPIQDSPLYEFFYEYIHDNKDQAFFSFCAWYWDQFIKYHDVSKAGGGMYFGSLYRLIKHNHEQAGKTFSGLAGADQAIIDASIKQRVTQRFELADRIISNSYVPDLVDPITVVKENRKYVLENGHHRACILAALGEKYLPQVHVRKGRLITDLFGPYVERK